MCAIARGETLDRFAGRPGVFSIINTNTPLQYDVPMTIGVMEMARHGQPVLLTPFVMAGASTPATIASAMALNSAEMLFGVTLGQLVRPGARPLWLRRHECRHEDRGSRLWDGRHAALHDDRRAAGTPLPHADALVQFQRRQRGRFVSGVESRPPGSRR